MKLVDKTIRDFSKVLASAAPAPGGGSSAALTGAIGAALLVMVALLTFRQKKFSEHEQLMQQAIMKAEQLRLKFLNIIDRDTDAFNQVSAVFAMPKDTIEQKTIRNAAMQEALKACTIVPFEMIGCVYDALGIASVMDGKYNTNAASDFGVAVLNLKTSAQSAWLNVLTNLDGIHDEIFTARYLIHGSELMQKVVALADEIYENVFQSLLPQS